MKCFDDHVTDFFDFVVIEVSSGKINGYSVLGIGMEIMGV